MSPLGALIPLSPFGALRALAGFPLNCHFGTHAKAPLNVIWDSLWSREFRKSPCTFKNTFERTTTLTKWNRTNGSQAVWVNFYFGCSQCGDWGQWFRGSTETLGGSTETLGGSSQFALQHQAAPWEEALCCLCWWHRKSVLSGGALLKPVLFMVPGFWCNGCLQPAYQTDRSVMGGWLGASVASLPINRSWWSSEKRFQSGNNPTPPTLCLPWGNYMEKSI